jgi:hypothetical protein
MFAATRPIAGRLLRYVHRRLYGEPDDYLEQCSGVIHVGANTGQERDIYARHDLKVAWIEPIPERFAILRKNIRSLSDQVAINALITDQDGKPYTFHVANRWSVILHSRFTQPQGHLARCTSHPRHEDEVFDAENSS